MWYQESICPLRGNTTKFFWRGGGFRFGNEVILFPNHGMPPHVPDGREMMWRTGTVDRERLDGER